MADNEKYFLAVPLAVLRKFVEMNKDKPDNWHQLFEIQPEWVFTQTQIDSVGGAETNGAVIINT